MGDEEGPKENGQDQQIEVVKSVNEERKEFMVFIKSKNSLLTRQDILIAFKIALSEEVPWSTPGEASDTLAGYMDRDKVYDA